PSYSLFCNDTAPTGSYPLSLHDALPILLFDSHCMAVLWFCAAAWRKKLDFQSRRFGTIGRAAYSALREKRWKTFSDCSRRTTDVDRKSTRLNSSHVKNSYAVFCLKKKTH